MSVTEGEPLHLDSMIQRIKALLLKPAPTFDVIAGEPATIPDLYRNWIVILALISPVCFAVGMVMFQSVPIGAALMEAAGLYLSWLIGAFLVSVIIAAVSARFEGSADKVQAMKLAAYAFTPSMLSGVFNLVPALAMLSIVGFYSFYLLWVGLPRLMKTPADKTLACYATIIGVMLAIGVVLGVVSTLLFESRF